MNRANFKGNNMDDKDIIDLYFSRDEKALEYTAQKYDSYCYAIAHRILGSEEDAKECVNDVLLAAWDSIPPNRPEKLSLYLGKITKNLSVNKLRTINAKKRGADYVRVCLDELGEVVPAENDPTALLESEELTRAIERGLKSVSATKQGGLSKPPFLFPIFSKTPENGLSMRFLNSNRIKLGKVESE